MSYLILKLCIPYIESDYLIFLALTSKNIYNELKNTN